MIQELADGPRRVGLKQSTRELAAGNVKKAFVARDSEENVRGPFVQLCKEQGVEVAYIDTMGALGEACGIDVGCAVAVLIK